MAKGPKVRDIAGERFGRWTVLSHSHRVLSRHYWNCRCECGTERPVGAAELRRGGSLSCGCIQREAGAARSSIRTKHPAYNSWKGMIHRCENPGDVCYHLYGGRGIAVCDEWQTFEGFLADMGASYFKGASIDRKENDDGYHKDNCRWATKVEQGRNRRDNVIIDTPKGPMNVSEATEVFGLKRHTIWNRLRYGWSGDDLFRPPGKRG